jgi:hypothetical protein
MCSLADRILNVKSQLFTDLHTFLISYAARILISSHSPLCLGQAFYDTISKASEGIPFLSFLCFFSFFFFHSFFFLSAKQTLQAYRVITC